MRIDKMITKVEIALIFYKILSTHSLKRCMEVSLENFYVDIGASRVKTLNFILKNILCT